MVDSWIGSVSEEGFESKFVVGPSSSLLDGSVLGMQADSDSGHSVTEEFSCLPFSNQLRETFNIMIIGCTVCALRMRALPLVMPKYPTGVALD